MCKKIITAILTLFIAVATIKRTNDSRVVFDVPSVLRAQIGESVNPEIDYDECNQVYYTYLQVLEDKGYTFSDTVDDGLQEYETYAIESGLDSEDYNQAMSNIAVARNDMMQSSQNRVGSSLVFSAMLLLLSLIGVTACVVGNELRFFSELLKRAALKNDDLYTDVKYKGRMLSNSTFIEYAKGVGQYQIDSRQNRNQVDTFMAVHGVTLSVDPNSYNVHVFDTYDFSTDNCPTLELLAYNAAGIVLKKLGIIDYYDIEFDLDISKYLEIISYQTYSNRYRVTVHNNSNDDRELIYNQSLTDYDLAREWRNLNDCTSIFIPRNSSVTFDVLKDDTKNTLAMSFLEGKKRYITTADGFSSSSPLNTELIECVIEEQEGITNFGLIDGQWNIDVENTELTDDFVDYYQDMRGSNGTNDFTDSDQYITESLVAQSHLKIRINNNNLGYISFRIRRNITEKRYTISSLNSNGNMNVCCRSLALLQYLSLKNEGKIGNKWKIAIKNETGIKQTVYYNEKMCFESDGRNWTNLLNVTHIELEHGETTEVLIQENWFATSITTSYLKNGHRIITYARGLKADHSIVCMTNYI